MALRLKTGYFPTGRRLTAFLLAVVFSLLPVLSVEFGAFTAWADGEGRGETHTYYGTQNLLKEGVSQEGAGKVSQGHYILGQAATWAIMSGNWDGLEDFRKNMQIFSAVGKKTLG